MSCAGNLGKGEGCRKHLKPFGGTLWYPNPTRQSWQQPEASLASGRRLHQGAVSTQCTVSVRKVDQTSRMREIRKSGSVEPRTGDVRAPATSDAPHVQKSPSSTFAVPPLLYFPGHQPAVSIFVVRCPVHSGCLPSVCDRDAWSACCCRTACWAQRCRPPLVTSHSRFDRRPAVVVKPRFAKALNRRRCRSRAKSSGEWRSPLL